MAAGVRVGPPAPEGSAADARGKETVAAAIKATARQNSMDDRFVIWVIIRSTRPA
jgi:hypothetical protein